VTKARGRYSPERGDLVWLEFNPQAGHEQKGHRPAVVLSPLEYNRKVGLALVCPLTTKEKGYPFEVQISGDGENRSSVILADQVRSVDWRARSARRFGRVSEATLAEVTHKLSVLIGT
jgi:mRNA interferase MazF